MGGESGKTFSLLNCLFLLGAVPIDGGFGESDAVTITPKSDTWKSTEGVDGSVAWAATGSGLYTIKISLLQTGRHNATLSGIWLTQKATGLALPFVFKDASGLDAFVSPACMITKGPEIKRGNKINSQEWMLEAADGKPFWGGN